MKENEDVSQKGNEENQKEWSRRGDAKSWRDNVVEEGAAAAIFLRMQLIANVSRTRRFAQMHF